MVVMGMGTMLMGSSSITMDTTRNGARTTTTCGDLVSGLRMYAYTTAALGATRENVLCAICVRSEDVAFKRRENGWEKNKYCHIKNNICMSKEFVGRA